MMGNKTFKNHYIVMLHLCTVYSKVRGSESSSVLFAFIFCLILPLILSLKSLSLLPAHLPHQNVSALTVFSEVSHRDQVKTEERIWS
jgi:hypothetical protein